MDSHGSKNVITIRKALICELYLTIIPLALVGYELAITILYPTSASGIIVLLQTPKIIAILKLPSCFRWLVTATKFVVNGI